MRALSIKFMDDFLQLDGMLHPILARLKRDDTLMLAIRDGFVNIYYRGGNILEVSETKKGFYRASFDEQYNKSGEVIPNLPKVIKTQDDAKGWVDAFPYLKYIMDGSFASSGKSEREFQQLVARENNNSSISNESDYFISDIEVSESDINARFDMIAIRWLTTKRRSGDNCQVAFIEMKYGDKVLGGKAGLLKHLKDMDSLITNREHYANLLNVIEHQFNQLDQLGLLNFNKGQKYVRIKVDPNQKPEVIFILANHNPRATGLKTILNTPEIAAYNESQLFDLRFFVASFAGYGLHSKCMRDLVEFRELLIS